MAEGIGVREEDQGFVELGSMPMLSLMCSEDQKNHWLTRAAERHVKQLCARGSRV